MKTFKSLSIRLIFISLISGLGLIFPNSVAAHPLDEFYQATFITIVPNRITIQIELYTGILVAPEIMTVIDTDQDDEISEAEGQTYVDLFLKGILKEPA